MIDSGIINSLSLSYSQEIVEKAVKKLESKIADGSFKNTGNTGGIISYLQQMCESYKREPKERSESYSNYFAENTFPEFVKRNGPGWFASVLSKINNLSMEKILDIKKRAESNFWFYKVYAETPRDITREEAKMLEKMYVYKDRNNLTDEERKLSDKVLKMESDIKNKALQEAMAVVYEIYYSREDY